MEHVIAILALGALCGLWVLVQRWSGREVRAGCRREGGSGCDGKGKKEGTCAGSCGGGAHDDEGHEH